MSEIPNIPLDIIIDILYRLPAKSLARFRCVSKLWLSVLIDSKFIKTHLNKNIKNKKLLAVYKSNLLHALTLTPEDNYVSRKLNFPPDLDRTRFQIVGSCGGLVALLRFQNPKVMFFINPTSSKYKKLQEMPLNLGVSKYGFGYDEYSDDFKIVRLWCYYDDYVSVKYKLDDNGTFVDVYSLKSNCWTRIEVSPFYHISCSGDVFGVLLHGAIHWSSSRRTDYSSVIVAFDLSGEKLRGVEVPTYAKSSVNRLVVLDYCLCMLSENHHLGIDVWMMKEYGVQGSWIKLIRVFYEINFLIPGSLVGILILLYRSGKPANKRYSIGKKIHLGVLLLMVLRLTFCLVVPSRRAFSRLIPNVNVLIFTFSNY